MTVEIEGEKFRRTVLVRGTQPPPAKVSAYLVAKSATALEKLVKQESQFKHFINADLEPVVAFDKGFGLTQLTKPAPTYTQAWSWKENLDGGIKLIDVKKQDAKNWLNNHGKDSYTQEMLDMETLARWNGGSYHEWDIPTKKWVRKKSLMCDTQNGNIGWDTNIALNKGETEKDLRARDVKNTQKA